MVALLKSRDLYDDTMIILTSDHGEYLGFHRLLLKSGYRGETRRKNPRTGAGRAAYHSGVHAAR